MNSPVDCKGLDNSGCGECAVCLPPQGRRPGLLNDTPDFRRLAHVAASQAATATAELIQSSLEGPLHHRTLWNDEPIEKLADATKIAIEASIEAGEVLDGERGQLLGALRRYLEGWV